MTNVERFHAIMNFQPVDRLPMLEWAFFWDKTITRWHSEGLPTNLKCDGEDDVGNISEYLGLDSIRQCWFKIYKEPEFAAYCKNNCFHGDGPVRGMESYSKIRPLLFVEKPFDQNYIQQCAARHAKGETIVWITLEGFFWFPRMLFGIEPHILAFYDHPEVMHAINEDIVTYYLRILDRFCEICKPDFMTFAEDMSYNHGPMCSKSTFDEFLAPYYKRIVPRLKEYGIIPFVDTDGLVNDLVPWFLDVGIEGFLPLERMAGVDISEMRNKYPKLKMIGGFDKTSMCQGEQAMRNEFERILPVMKQGGYIPAVDHQTPPDVSLENYKRYLGLYAEYCAKAGARKNFVS
ncbi:MAG: hypothetical protein A2Y12_13010 [Planctomycetes bacterium GWF2_42_9]|nr:MAG: hypothetical protein A2Y12_13010 [Planctomycetes bacterium GWF2_42_9]